MEDLEISQMVEEYKDKGVTILEKNSEPSAELFTTTRDLNENRIKHLKKRRRFVVMMMKIVTVQDSDSHEEEKSPSKTKQQDV
ncbi:hypothetical protein OS493_039959 [Desmophyllum pertusum]|uniref:Uncharacterized protein n=1 Tax=Desmophyllum pertusum TaxID=174260 RepID=A0A9X0CDN3_9CNID|nr:hypothetical protein OS493_039959 [Desmophyllum pertusum]